MVIIRQGFFHRFGPTFFFKLSISQSLNISNYCFIERMVLINSRMAPVQEWWRWSQKFSK